MGRVQTRTGQNRQDWSVSISGERLVCNSFGCCVVWRRRDVANCSRTIWSIPCRNDFSYFREAPASVEQATRAARVCDRECIAILPTDLGRADLEKNHSACTSDAVCARDRKDNNGGNSQCCRECTGSATVSNSTRNCLARRE